MSFSLKSSPLEKSRHPPPALPKMGKAADNKIKAETPSQMRLKQNCLAGSSEKRQRELVAVCGVLSAILAVEHRAVQPHLAHIWHLLWLAAQGKHPHLQSSAVLVKTMMVLPCLDVRLVASVQSCHKGGAVCNAKRSAPSSYHELICQDLFLRIALCLWLLRCGCMQVALIFWYPHTLVATFLYVHHYVVVAHKYQTTFAHAHVAKQSVFGAH